MNYWLWKRKKRRHYKHKIDLTQRQIWDLEFLREKTRAVRESIRMDYDRIMEVNLAKKYFRNLIEAFGLERASELLKQGPEVSQPLLDKQTTKAILNPEEQNVLNALNEQIDGFDKDITQYKTQMDSFDGETGQIAVINTKIEGFQTVMGLLKQYVAKI